MSTLIDTQVVHGPWGGGNHWVRAFFDYYPSKEDDCFFATKASSLNHEYFRIPKKYKILRVNECDARKGTRGVDDEWIKASAYANATIWVSNWLKNYFGDRWLCKTNKVIKNGVNREWFKPTNNKLSNIDGKIHIVTAHWSDNPMKGQEYVEWLDDFVSKNTDFTYTYIGRTRAKLKNSRLIQPIFGKELGDELSRYDVCINASKFDPGPNSVIEPIVCGVPTYVHSLGGGGVEFAGEDHVFKSFDDVNDLLNSKKFIKNKDTFQSWEVVMKETRQFFVEVKNGA